MKLKSNHADKCTPVIVTFMLMALFTPLFLWEEYAKIFTIFANSLVGFSAVFTAYWAYKTFAFKERINEYNNIYKGLKKAEKAYLGKHSAHLRLLHTLLKTNPDNVEVASSYEEQISLIEREYKEAEEFLNDLTFSPFVSKKFKAQLFILIQANQFTDTSEIQKSFFKIKVLHQEEFIIKT